MDDKSVIVVASNLKRVRKSRSLTQQQMAELAEVTTNFYARVERGQKALSLKTLQKLCSKLGLKSTDILGF